uniref:Podocan like 1 n=1 Tax=Ornithorhynchus anatinus TaxID=9258 RepID=A0A6I8NRN3_ORNAN
QLSLLVLLLGIPSARSQDANAFPHPGESSQPPPRACPPRCSCPLDDTVDCEGLDLELFPDNITKAAQHLSLQNNQLLEIPYNELSRLSNLKTLNLHNNLISSEGLPDEAFESLSALQYIYLANNKNNRITWVPRGALSRQQKLRELYLQNNNLSDTGIDPSTFSKLKSLEYLDLSNNQLEEVPAGLPPGIVILHLGRNRIRHLPAERLSQVRGLQYLLLQNNELAAGGVHRDAFLRLRALHTLHLYNNRLERVPAGLPRRVRSLMLLHNRIGAIGPDDFATTYALTELNLSYNRLYSARLHRLAFRKLRQLQTLDLAGNHLTLLPAGLPASLQVLKLQKNQLNTLGPESLVGMNGLKELHLAHNRLRIGSIAPGTWQEILGLKVR